MGTSYYQVLEEEKERATPKKSTPITILLQKEFLKDLSKFKRREDEWFKKLEEELEKMEMEDAILKFKK